MAKTLLKISIVIFSFTVALAFLLPPQIIGVSFSKDAVLTVEFSKPIKRQRLQPAIIPLAHGEWQFTNPLVANHLYRTLVFVPALDLEPGTEYQVQLKEVISSLATSLSTDYSFSFMTEPSVQEKGMARSWSESFSLPLASEITLMDIPLDWQDKKLSCEAASLKMALGYKKVFVSENDIMAKIGCDLTPHQNNIWGDPNRSYVGDIDGKICVTGYGVHWQPVAKAASYWREVEAFSNWDLQDLTKELEAGNPVVFWGTMPVETLTDCSWHTAQGEYIKTYQETHVRLAVGFIGSAADPKKIIINDPLSGKLYWPTSYFLTNWGAFDYSGVAIR